eukprot:CAMPEP_0184648234 /NCGR_PEP_ID=MMETSP0308-20130426/5310_1 /TAXON_ID=38269 /ORGANISM="Gloeochaete witrockiana, Strain SAG 46.84" /LENGTH=261 /DNA_ID=CAMNT_0027079895 /DNA_START=57 /DNA_END=838 /DNA_ORIENTATION=+
MKRQSMSTIKLREAMSKRWTRRLAVSVILSLLCFGCSTRLISGIKRLLDQSVSEKDDNQEILAAAVPALKKLNSGSSLGFDQIFVITLQRRTDRQEHMKRFCSEWRLDCALHFGIDLRDEEKLIPFKARVLEHAKLLKPGEIGCYGSHFEMLQEIVDRGYNQTLVLEDDIVMSRDVPDAQQLQLAVSGVLEYVHDKYDIVYFGHCCWGWDQWDWTRQTGHAVHRNKKTTYTVKGGNMCSCTHAYALSKEGAVKILKALQVV